MHITTETLVLIRLVHITTETLVLIRLDKKANLIETKLTAWQIEIIKVCADAKEVKNSGHVS